MSMNIINNGVDLKKQKGMILRVKNKNPLEEEYEKGRERLQCRKQKRNRCVDEI